MAFQISLWVTATVATISMCRSNIGEYSFFSLDKIKEFKID